MVVVQYLAGEVGIFEAVDDLVHGTLDNFARFNDCDGIEFFGRAGWKRIARKYGYNDQVIVFEKNLK
jgi:hypothetical protein